jgi:hypothetical protein
MESDRANAMTRLAIHSNLPQLDQRLNTPILSRQTTMFDFLFSRLNWPLPSWPSLRYTSPGISSALTT